MKYFFKVWAVVCCVALATVGIGLVETDWLWFAFQLLAVTFCAAALLDFEVRK